MGKKKNNRILNCLGAIVFEQHRQGFILESILMKQTELAAITAQNTSLIKINGEYAAFIREVTEKDAQDAETIAALTEQVEILRAQVGELADPAEAQAALDQSATLIAQLDSNRTDLKIPPEPEVVEPIE